MHLHLHRKEGRNSAAYEAHRLMTLLSITTLAAMVSIMAIILVM